MLAITILSHERLFVNLNFNKIFYITILSFHIFNFIHYKKPFGTAVLTADFVYYVLLKEPTLTRVF